MLWAVSFFRHTKFTCECFSHLFLYPATDTMSLSEPPAKMMNDVIVSAAALRLEGAGEIFGLDFLCGRRFIWLCAPLWMSAVLIPAS